MLMINYIKYVQGHYRVTTAESHFTDDWISVVGRIREFCTSVGLILLNWMSLVDIELDCREDLIILPSVPLEKQIPNQIVS
jgi:hypothetical protein